MLERSLEIIIGAFVIVAALFFFIFSLSARSDNTYDKLYSLTALYNNIGELKNGDNVKIAGVSVGHVKSISLDEKNYNARVTLLINSSVKLPTDSKAQIMIGGLFGNSEVRIIPGQNTNTLPPQSEIAHTIDAFSLEDIIGELLYNTVGTSP